MIDWIIATHTKKHYTKKYLNRFSFKLNRSQFKQIRLSQKPFKK